VRAPVLVRHRQYHYTEEYTETETVSDTDTETASDTETDRYASSPFGAVAISPEGNAPRAIPQLLTSNHPQGAILPSPRATTVHIESCTGPSKPASAAQHRTYQPVLPVPCTDGSMKSKFSHELSR
jgi:hypothetical protein